MSILLKASFNDLIFEKRNQSFGAYFLRNIYSSNLMKAFFIASIAFSFFIIAPIAATFFSTSEKEKITEIVEVTLEDIPPLDPTAPPPPPLPVTQPTEPQISKVKFLPPVVKPDEEVKVDELPPTDKQLEESNPGEKNQEGSKDGVELIQHSAPVAIEEPKKEEIYVYVPKMPEPKGGLNSFLKFLSENLEYSKEAKTNHIEGKVIVEFYVDTDGSLRNLKVVKGLGYSLDEEALRVINIAPHWTPGLKDGKPVRVKQRIPILFELE